MLLIVLVSLLSAVFSCAPDEFQCGDGTCITIDFVCDSFDDCKDGSDEIGCTAYGCKSDEFQCSDEICITNEFRCDGFRDCKDGSDELGCNGFQNVCSEGCNEPILLYEDLQCRPIWFSNETCCPTAFDCSHIERRANSVEQKCYFHGKGYNINETISTREIYGTCSSHCLCRLATSGGMDFQCTEAKCAERINNKQSCKTGDSCGVVRPKCRIGDKSYFEGQKFDSLTEKCKYCTCKKSIPGRSPSIFCTSYQCIQEIKYHKEITNFCAPSYLTMDDCCPINWICPNNEETITWKPLPIQVLGAKCRFGNLLFGIGNKFKREHPSGGKVVCECRIPPYLTCIQDYTYPTHTP